MTYSHVVKGEFVARPNRFVATVRINGAEETVHVKNTGRCRELLLPGVTVYLAQSDNPFRKTRYDLVAVEKIREGKERLLINMDSQIPNEVAAEWLRGNLFSEKALVRREVTFGTSRFDFYIEDSCRRVFLEVKGVTLEKDGVALFPDAPTERGVKHLHELVSCLDEGYEAFVLFVIQMKGPVLFRPNDVMHKAFGDALRLAHAKGVKVLAVDCQVTPDSLTISEPVAVELSSDMIHKHL